jgi:hypothetical protein
MEISPLDVFSVMLENCKGNEAETGASRRNVLDFLLNHAAKQRQALLQSGKHEEVQAAFKAGLENVMRSLGADSEEREVLSALLWDLELGQKPSPQAKESARTDPPAQARHVRPSQKRDREQSSTPKVAPQVIVPPSRSRAEDLAENRPRRPPGHSFPPRGTSVLDSPGGPSIYRPIHVPASEVSKDPARTGTEKQMDTAPIRLPSLLDRLHKRPRDAVGKQEYTGGSSLMKRIGSIDNHHKKQRITTKQPVGIPSLRDRMSRLDTRAPALANDDSIRDCDRQPDPVVPQLNRPQPVPALSIKNHSAQSASSSPGLSIRSAATAALLQEPSIVRKGRGFQKTSDDILIMPACKGRQ